MAKPILIVRVPVDFEGDLVKWFDHVQDEYFIFILGGQAVEELSFEFPKNCELPNSELEKIKEAVLVK